MRWEACMLSCLSRCVRRTDGTELIEYALLGAAIAIFCWVGVTQLGGALGNSYAAVVTGVANGGTEGGASAGGGGGGTGGGGTGGGGTGGGGTGGGGTGGGGTGGGGTGGGGTGGGGTGGGGT